MPDPSAALADLHAVARRARDLADGVGQAIDDARLLAWQTAWRAPSASAFHARVTDWLDDLIRLRTLLAVLEDEAIEGARRVQRRLDDAAAMLAGRTL